MNSDIRCNIDQQINEIMQKHGPTNEKRLLQARNWFKLPTFANIASHSNIAQCDKITSTSEILLTARRP